MNEDGIDLYPWPEVVSDRIPTRPFLKCCEDFIQRLGTFGTIMNQVKNDMNGNVNKLKKVYYSNPEKYEYLLDMIQSERLKKSSPAPDALLWLKRALHFIYAMLNCIIQTIEEQGVFPDMKSEYLTCYENILRPHHNWAVQKAFTLCINRGLLPEPRALLLAMPRVQRLGQDCSPKEIATEVKPFMSGLRNNLTTVLTFYHSEGLDAVEGL